MDIKKSVINKEYKEMQPRCHSSKFKYEFKQDILSHLLFAEIKFETYSNFEKKKICSHRNRAPVQEQVLKENYVQYNPEWKTVAQDQCKIQT